MAIATTRVAGLSTLVATGTGGAATTTLVATAGATIAVVAIGIPARVGAVAVGTVASDVADLTALNPYQVSFVMMRKTKTQQSLAL